MNYTKILDKMKADIARATKKYHRAETIEERKSHISSIANNLNYIKKILSTNIPSYLKPPFQNLYHTSRTTYEDLKTNIDKFP